MEVTELKNQQRPGASGSSSRLDKIWQITIICIMLALLLSYIVLATKFIMYLEKHYHDLSAP